MCQKKTQMKSIELAKLDWTVHRRFRQYTVGNDAEPSSLV